MEELKNEQEIQDFQELQEIQENQELQENQESQENQENQELQENQENQESQENQENQELQENQENQELQENQENQENQETQETEIETKKPLEIRNVQEIKDGFLSVEVKNLYGDDFCQYIFDPKTEQNEELLELLKTADIKPYVVDIEALKKAKLAELETKASAFENNENKDMFFKSSVKGYLINGDRRTRSNIQDLITYQPTDIVIYRDYENIERNLTKDELKIMLKEHVMNGQMLYNQKWAFEKQINACTSIDDLNKIEIRFIMQDFSENV